MHTPPGHRLQEEMSVTKAAKPSEPSPYLSREDQLRISMQRSPVVWSGELFVSCEIISRLDSPSCTVFLYFLSFKIKFTPSLNSGTENFPRSL